MMKRAKNWKHFRIIILKINIKVMVIFLINNLKWITFIFPFFILIGCSDAGLANKQGGKHLEHVYEAAENHVTFPYVLPYFEDYTVVAMHYTPQDKKLETEETLIVSYNANVFITAEMEELMQQNTTDNNRDVGDLIYGPYYQEDDTVLTISLIMKRNPFEVVSHNKDRTQLNKMKIEEKEIIYDYMEDNKSGFIFEVEKEGTYYRVFVEITSKMTKDEVEKRIKEMLRAILL